MVGNYLAKVCIKGESDKPEEYAKLVADKYKNNGNIVYVQRIDNETHGKWLADQKTMYWDFVIDIYSGNESFDEFVEDFKQLWTDISNKHEDLIDACDVYIAEDMKYKTPLKNAEIITSCYEWNYETEENIRENVMKEHFILEQRQVLYDYVSFQSVKIILYDRSKVFDFFFESHVSDENGIDKIYGEEVLEEMRTHSKMFLNTDTRHLSFGSVSKY